MAKLPERLRDFARFGYLSGWRRGEIQTLAWADIDRAAGVSQSVAMSITGHKTISIYHRDRIVGVDDQRRALEQAQAANTGRSERTAVLMRRRGTRET